MKIVSNLPVDLPDPIAFYQETLQIEVLLYIFHLCNCHVHQILAAICYIISKIQCVALVTCHNNPSLKVLYSLSELANNTYIVNFDCYFNGSSRV